MVYISKGVIEILSSENGESGVLALTSGTCVGEASLLFPYISDVDFRCKTTTELFTLHRNDFVILCRHHPAVYRDFLQQILKRYKDAKKFIDVKRNHPKGLTNLLQLKNNLHRLSSKNKDLYSMHAPENIYLANELNYKCEMYPFNTMRYLELLSIKERIHFDTDIVFIKSTGMWILKPNSPVLAAWEYIVLVFCLIVALWIPYMCSMKKRFISNEFIILFNILWWIDFIILSVTPVNSESRATTMVTIMSERIKHISFACDIIAVVPSFMLTSLLPHKLVEFNRTWLYMNKVLKVYRIFKFLNDWERQFNVNILLHTALKYGFLYIMLIYYTSCVMVAFGNSEGLFTTIAVQMASGVGYLYSDVLYIPYTIVLDYISYFLEFAATNAIIAAVYLRYNNRKKIQTFFARVFHCTHQRTDKKYLLRRLNLCIETHLNDNDGLMLMVSMPKFLGLSPFFMNMVQTEGFVDILSSVEMISFMPKGLIAKLSVICHKVIYHRQCVLISRGVIYDQVFILYKGVAKKVVGKQVYDTEMLTMLNLLEICYGLPSAMTVICLTEVVCLYFKYSDFERLLTEFPETNELFKSNLRANEGIRELLMRIGRAKSQSKLIVKDYDYFQFWKFKKGKTATIYENHDYHGPFNKLGMFAFVRFVLMRKTVHPESKFLVYWERFRFSFAILSSILFLIPFFNSNSSSPNVLLFLLLDLTAYADVYFRMHVCYYNEIGILVKHPLETARHYLKHGFFVDLLGVIPINYIIADDDIAVTFAMSCLRLIQVHRFYSYKASFMWPSVPLQLAVNFITVVIFINFCSSVIVVNDCDNSYKNGTEWVVLCKTLNMEYFDIFSYYFYVVSSTVTTVSMDTYISFEHSYFLITFLAYLSSVSVIIKIYIVSNIFSSFCSNDVRLPISRKSTASLLHFMRKRKVSLYLRREIKKYFDTSWMVIGDGNPFELYANLNTSLKRDLLFEFYGPKLTGHSLLSDNKLLLEDFFKNCLIEMNMMTFNKDGYILTINDIQGKIFFLHTGYVDVVAADGTVLDTLGESSIFGNMENVTLFRQKVTVVTNTTVLVFFMKTKTFYMLINYFPHIKKTFLRLMQYKQYYIESSAPKMIRKMVNLRHYNKAMVRYRLFRKFSLLHALLPCYVGVMMELYQMAVCEISGNFLALQFSLDVMHTVHSVCKFFVGYLDDNWELITERKLVKKPHMKKTEMAITVISCLPLDYFMLMVFNINGVKEQCFFFNLLRINRVLRIYYLIRYFSDHLFKYTLTNGYTVWKRCCVFVLEITMYVTTCATFLIMSERIFWYITKKKSFSVHYYKVRLWMSRIYRAPSSIKFDIYFKYCYFVMMFLTFKSDRNYYISSTMIMSLYMIVVLASYICSILMFAQLFEIIVECLSPHVHYGHIINFIMHYLRSHASPIIKLKLSSQMQNSWFHMQSHSLKALNLAPSYLKQSVMYSIYGHLFTNHIIFGRSHPDFVRQVLVHAKQVFYLCDDIITYKDVDRECMYFIVSGKVAVLEDEIHCFQAAHEVLNAGDSFGIIEGIFPKHPYKYTYKTVGNCEILELLLKDWKYLLDFFPATKEHILDVHTNMNLY
ncbi:PREDICTED: uncharacterized protein LOC108566778 [Nicrophorus vespilloides]|uniref:Uncharacterized protein LOC108566778 n=1 Tax=Nicrophorus vespilloides TaxID=110193 RepID=A0ABM1N656_NICVS|nr:PREDICTED: uncharacterized protein LOC108566778 [Nicrophorus vespilloides]XP_017782315.1 PREDICTED: uncharacterized protein LOC108566778 [Nicrophorus vespilloides]XP_017782324.1 PREDICTED: uncharacterized protein LOC108566778 [Nicrophorus vespilloides]